MIFDGKSQSYHLIEQQSSVISLWNAGSEIQSVHWLALTYIYIFVLRDLWRRSFSYYCLREVSGGDLWSMGGGCCSSQRGGIYQKQEDAVVVFVDGGTCLLCVAWVWSIRLGEVEGEEEEENSVRDPCWSSVVALGSWRTDCSLEARNLILLDKVLTSSLSGGDDGKFVMLYPTGWNLLVNRFSSTAYSSDMHASKALFKR